MFSKYKSYEETVRIYYAEVHHMQCTPAQPPKGWLVQHPRKQLFKNQASGWVFSDDVKTYRPAHFETLEGAIKHCKNNGIFTRYGL